MGRERLERTIAVHESYVAKKKAEEEHYIANKRQIVASKSQPRWAPASNHGEQFCDPFCDPNYLFRKDLGFTVRNEVHAEGV